MVTDHSKHLEELQQLFNSLNIQPADTSMIQKLKTDSKAAEGKLSGLQGAAFDHAYIDQMVKDHTKALSTIDNHCMKNATDPQLKSFLQATRTTVESHLEEAKKIQASLKSAK